MVMRAKSSAAAAGAADDGDDEEVKELYAYGAGLQCLSDIAGLYRFLNLEFLSLHGNRIESMKGLEGLRLLKEVNLSSNNIRRMEAISHLSHLQVLNLSCNQIEEIKDLCGLLALKKLLLSHNKISSLEGLAGLHGPRYSLQLLDLRDNIVTSLLELEMLAGCVSLVELVFSWGGHTNPVCQAPAYKSTIIAAAPHVLKLDGETLSPGLKFCRMPCGLSPSERNALGKQITGRVQTKQQFLSCKEVIPPPEPNTLSLSTIHRRRVNVQPESYYCNSSQNQAYLNQGRFQNQIPASADEPHDNCSRCRTHLSGFESEPGTGVEIPLRMDQPSSCQFLSTEDAPCPDRTHALASSEQQTSHDVCNFSLQSKDDLTHGRQTHRRLQNRSNTEIIRGVSKILKVDRSNQTDHETWLGALEQKILDLVQQSFNIKSSYQRANTDRHVDEDDVRSSLDVAKSVSDLRSLDWRKILGQDRRKRKEINSELKTSGDSSSNGETSDSLKLRSQSFARSLSSSVEGGSRSPENQAPVRRRWVHFGDKEKRRKDSTRSRRNLCREVNVTEDGDKSALERSHKEEMTGWFGKSDTELEDTEDQKAFKRLCEEVRNLQAGVASLTATIKSAGAANTNADALQKKMEPRPQRNTDSEQILDEASMCKLVENCALLENKLISEEEQFSEEKKNLLKRLEAIQEERNELHKKYQREQEENSNLRQRLEEEMEKGKQLEERVQVQVEEIKGLHKALEARQSAVCDLQKQLQSRKEREEEFSKDLERVVTEKAQKELCLQEKYHGKFLSLNIELVSLKEALTIANQARQDAECALLDATAEKNSRQQSCMLEECANLKACKAELDASRSHELELQHQVDKASRDLLDARVKNQEALAQLSKLHKQELQDAIAKESAAGETRGRTAAEMSFEQFRSAMNLKVASAQEALQEALQENVRLKQEVGGLREEKHKEEAKLKESVRVLLFKEQGKEALVVELSSVVRSQKMKLQAVQLDLQRLAQAEKDLLRMHQEMLALRRRADKYDGLVVEVNDLQQKMAEIHHDAERKSRSLEEGFQAELSSLQNENRRLLAEAEKLEAAEVAVKIKNKMLDSQNETIRELKTELAQAKEAFKKALETSEALESEWLDRLQTQADQVSQGEELRNKFEKQELTITSLEEKLKLERAARIAAEKSSKSLQEKLSEKEGMFRYVEEEILQVKELYDSRLRAVSLERDQGLEKLKAADQEKEQLVKDLGDAKRKQQDLTDASKARQSQEMLWKEDLQRKDLQLAETHQRMVEIEAELKSQDAALESQKVSSASKLDRLHKLVEELQDGP